MTNVIPTSTHPYVYLIVSTDTNLDSVNHGRSSTLCNKRCYTKTLVFFFAFKAMAKPMSVSVETIKYTSGAVIVEHGLTFVTVASSTIPMYWGYLSHMCIKMVVLNIWKGGGCS